MGMLTSRAPASLATDRLSWCAEWEWDRRKINFTWAAKYKFSDGFVYNVLELFCQAVLFDSTRLGSYSKILAQAHRLTFGSAFVLACHNVILNYVHCDTICMNKQCAELVCNDLWKAFRQHSLQWDMWKSEGVQCWIIKLHYQVCKYSRINI